MGYAEIPVDLTGWRQTVLGLQTASLDVMLDLLAGVVAAIDFGLKC